MANFKLTRRGFTAGIVASLTPVGAATASAVESIMASVSTTDHSNLPSPKASVLNRISDMDQLYLTPTAWEQNLATTGTLSL